MVYKVDDIDTTAIVAQCKCGCDEAIQIKRFKDEDDDYYLSLVTTKFSQQRGIFRTIEHRIKLAWLMLMGKEYRFTEVVLSKEDIKTYIERLKEI